MNGIVLSSVLNKQEIRLLLATETHLCLALSPRFRFSRTLGRVIVEEEKLQVWEQEFSKRKAPKLKIVLQKLRSGIQGDFSVREDITK